MVEQSGLTALPLVGRAVDTALLQSALQRAERGGGGLVALTGEAGVGKTRLAEVIASEAERHGFSVARGRAYPVETGVPYALFADALVSLFRSVPPDQLASLLRGASAELAYLFPSIARLASSSQVRPSGAPGEDPAEFKTRLFWSLTQVLKALAVTSPLMILLDDVHLADASSQELLHFIARQTTDSAILLVCTYAELDQQTHPALRAIEQSLASLGIATIQRVQPLTFADTTELVRSVFHADEVVTRHFTALLYDWTRGNPFFVQETLQSLIRSGQLRRVGAQWLGWEIRKLDLPRTVRDAVIARIERLSAGARSVADLCAVIGSRLRYELLRALAHESESDLLAALDELRQKQILSEEVAEGVVVYDFVHPMLGQVLYNELGLSRARLLHASVAETLERLYGDNAFDHAGELAHHFSRADVHARGAKTLKYLFEAGRRALARYANQEAADYLSLALGELDDTVDDRTRADLTSELARARQRLGDYAGAIELWEQLLEKAAAHGDTSAVSALERRVGLALYWAADYTDALQHLEAGLVAAEQQGAQEISVRIRLARAACLTELGRAPEAHADVEAARVTAEPLGDDALTARTHRALLHLYTWTGPAERAREHGLRSIELAERCGDQELMFSSHWAMGLLEGLTGNAEPMAHHIGAAERIAEELRAPLLGLSTAELRVEYCYGAGEWDRGIATGERAIALARALNQKSVLVRLLVWTSLIYLGRADYEKATPYINEAWELSGASKVHEDTVLDVYTVVPAHIGRAALHMSKMEYADAIRVGEAALALADRTGYVFWAIHRLLPIIAESYCHLLDVEGATRYEARLRRDSERLDHRFGLAWADIFRAVVHWLNGDLQLATTLLRAGAESLEAIPNIPDAARARRQLAGRLADLDDREGALLELRRVHVIFERLGAHNELQKARGMFREIDARPPSRAAAEGVEGLTARELEIAGMVAARKSNKLIGRILDISPRTVSTNLSNMFRKLGVSTRAGLTDYVRTHSLPAFDAPSGPTIADSRYDGVAGIPSRVEINALDSPPDLASRLGASLAGRYAIERELGKGGMGTVFLARDIKHARHVAIKVLHPELARSVGADRFLLEIRTTAQLTHPHILTLHDSGESDGLLYYVMPYIQGDSLRSLLLREKRLSVSDAVCIATDVAAALDHAHTAGIVHRDIKPENILLPSRSHAVVADFGLAHAVFSASNNRLTVSGLTIGSPWYMSPEQAVGEREVDGRSDIYSLACVVFEMLAGRPPFCGENIREVVGKHISAPAPPLRSIRADVTPRMQKTLLQAMEKSPEDRFDSAQRFAEALKSAAEAADRSTRAPRLPWVTKLLLVFRRSRD